MFRRHSYTRILAVIAIISLCCNWLFIKSKKTFYGVSDTMVGHSRSFLPEETGFKFILQWTVPGSVMKFVNLDKGQEGFIRKKCKVNKCFVTPDRMYLKRITDFDAIAFYGPSMQQFSYELGVFVDTTIPANRNIHQKYVYASMESPHNFPICDKIYDGFFNWTWTYKLDSDVLFGYITVRNIGGDIIGPKQNMDWIQVASMKPIDEKIKKRLKRKNKAAAWFVSKCKTRSRRESLVSNLQRELKKYGMQVDVFGGCGPKKCAREKKDDCLQILERDYYFYLSLENSFAEDYVTEKLLYPLQHYAVPVVFGGANYTRFMPDGIYLHGGKLQPKALAKEMHDIINDKERYYSFFKWHNHYSYHARDESPDSDDLCRMCEMLHDDAFMKKTTVHTNFRKWWNVLGHCIYPLI